MRTSSDRLWEGHRWGPSHPGGHHGDPVTVAGPPEWLSATLPVAVLVATTVLCGLMLTRPLAGDLSRTARRVVVVASVVATGGELLVLAVGDDRMSVPVLARLALTTVAPVLLQRRPAALCGGVVLTAAVGMHGSGVTEPVAGLVHVAAASTWLGAAVLVATATAEDRTALVRRLTPWAIGAGLVVAGTGVVRTWSTGVDPAAALVRAGVLVALVVIGVVVHRRPAGRLARIEAAGLAVAVAAAGGVLVTTTAQPPPDPGVPLLRTVAVGQTPVPLLVVPHRPGPNLVHTTVSGVSVGVDGERMTPAVPRDGADGTWAVVDLPAGQSRLWLSAGDARTAVDIDTGYEEGRVDLSGPDGPECASAALGALLAGAREPLTRCPSDRLAGTDTAALRALVGFLAGRGVPEVALLGDSSPRSVAVTEVVRAEAGRHRLAVTTTSTETSRPDAPLLVVSGWSVAATALRDTTAGRIPIGGTYLAPWLLAAPVLAAGSGVTLPVGFDPYGSTPLRYASAVGGAFPGHAPTAAGYAAWRVGVEREPVRLYAAVRVDVMPGMSGHSGHAGHGWLPGGRLTAVTGPLR